MQRLTAKQPMYEHVICPSAVQLLDVYMGAEAVPSEAVMWDLENPNDLHVRLPSERHFFTSPLDPLVSMDQAMHPCNEQKPRLLGGYGKLRKCCQGSCCLKWPGF